MPWFHSVPDHPAFYLNAQSFMRIPSYRINTCGMFLNKLKIEVMGYIVACYFTGDRQHRSGRATKLCRKLSGFFNQFVI